MFFQPTRKHPRVPLSVEVRVDCHDHSLTVTSTEIGTGGMALKNTNSLSVAQPILVSFTLPGGDALSIPAVVWWKKGGLVGIRFDPSDGKRLIVERWVEEQKRLV